MFFSMPADISSYQILDFANIPKSKLKRPLDSIARKEEELDRLEAARNDPGGKDFHKRNTRKLAYSAVGTPDYVAPEVQGKSKAYLI